MSTNLPDFSSVLKVVLDEAYALLKTLDQKALSGLFKDVASEWKSKRLFFWARGRSFLILKAFAMRLMHLGYRVYIVGEVDCPAIGDGDVLVVASGSGSTSSVLLFSEKAKNFGAQVVAFTGKADTPLAKIADVVVSFKSEKAPPSIQLFANGSGTRFEDALFLFFDACILYLIWDRREKAYQEMMLRHANLE
ncbi:MAG: 6-phospho-3-hexuloisomerase [Candidatus Atribacteria bacterium]|jgi:6-phospho 3-hexuloisomerase|uniref:SIS domain-containing protein n=1 Tax=Thermatribacter velox TaxID=3039681 RepID=A0ABZ2Y9T1_9BACT|nr:6-phospho-3-hexuloisomerase [Candidatus Atribacteria bacterium]